MCSFIPATLSATLTSARRIVMDAGLRYLYTGKVHDRAGDQTLCPRCGMAAVRRDCYRIPGYDLDPEGLCRHCASAIAGRSGPLGPPFGARRIPVRIGP
ncbi:MAG: hypothetical protein FAZ92_00445 [Accumulibacter sp.]|uniref:hypothetical protein n=1 Tax=Accumulibacter sp. TaxID=2053492 RepID=UPI001227125B|nr:hypothetical protein [Accumulibacter sp.]TLD47305.1 MAG: hypothetical protein FAZ92_00445 [Accumulibacter sp.]